MPITDAAKKALKQSKKHRKLNERYKKQMKESIKEIEDLVEAGEIEAAEQSLSKAYKAIDKAAKKNIIHQNKADRKKSQLAQRIKEA